MIRAADEELVEARPNLPNLGRSNHQDINVELVVLHPRPDDSFYRPAIHTYDAIVESLGCDLTTRPIRKEEQILGELDKLI